MISSRKRKFEQDDKHRNAKRAQISITSQIIDEKHRDTKSKPKATLNVSNCISCSKSIVTTPLSIDSKCRLSYLKSINCTQSDQLRDIVILFIAHDGVHQATLWENWRAESQNRQRIKFLVQYDIQQLK